MKLTILTTLLTLAFSVTLGQVQVKSFELRKGKFTEKQKFGIEIKHAYWKDSDYHISFLKMTGASYEFDGKVEFKDGKLNLIFDRKRPIPPDDAIPACKEFRYVISGLNTKEFKLRFNGERQSWYPMERDEEVVFLEPEIEAPPVYYDKEPDQQEEVFQIVEEMPYLKSCVGSDNTDMCSQKKLMEFISKNIEYPQMAIEAGVQGRVFVQFTIFKDGSTGDHKVLRGVLDEMDKEALRVVKMLPEFEPGKQMGRPVNVRYIVPISFKLN